MARAGHRGRPGVGVSGVCQRTVMVRFTPWSRMAWVRCCPLVKAVVAQMASVGASRVCSAWLSGELRPAARALSSA